MLKLFQTIQRRTPLGWLQLTHHKSRFAVAIAGVAFADILILLQLGFQGALFNSATRLHKMLDADVVIYSPQALNFTAMSTFPRRRLFQAMDVTGVQSVDAMYVSPITWKNPQTREKKSLLIIGFNPDRPAFNFPEVNRQLDRIKQPDVLLFDSETRGTYDRVIADVIAGKTVTTEIDRRTISIGGVFKLGSSFGADGHLMTSQENYLRLRPRQSQSDINVGLVKVKPGYDPQQVAATLTAYLPKSDVRVLTQAEFTNFERSYWSGATPIGFIFNIGATMGFIVGVIIVYQVLSTDVNSHLKEYATFKAMGYSNSYLLGIVFEEALILAIAGFIPGLLISLGLYQIVALGTNLPVAMTVLTATQVIVSTLTMCTISGVVATSKVQAADPADMF
jgi:putative ABC transport system permease protein